MALGETAKLLTVLGLKDELSPGLNRAAGSVRKFDSGIAKSARGVGRFASGIGKTIAVGAAAAATGLVAAAKVAGDFGEQLNVINTIAQQSDSNLQAIGDGIRGLARETGADLSDLTSGYYDLLSAGVKVKDAQGDLTLAYKLSRGALSSTAEAVDVLTTAQNAYGLNTKQLAVVSDQFAQAVADGKLKLSDIASTFANVASVAKSAGIGIDQVAASYGFLTAQGVPAAEVTTELNRSIVELLKPNANLQSLEKKTGIDFLKEARTKGLVQSLEEMRIVAKKNGVSFQDLFGRLEGYKFALQTTGPAFAGYLAEQKRILNSNGALQKQYDERQKGLNYQLGRLKANLKDVGITIGSGFTPALGRAADKLVAFLNTDANRSKLSQIGKEIGDQIDRIDFDKLVSAAERAAEALKPMVDVLAKIAGAIDALPTEAKGAALGLFVANKASGGAIASGLGAIVGGLATTLTKSLAANIPIFGKAFVQPVFVTNLGGGLGGGIPGVAGEGTSTLGKLAGIASKVVVVGIVAEAAKTLYDNVASPLAQGIKDQVNGGKPLIADLHGDQLEWPFGPKNTPTILPEIFGGNGLLGGFARDLKVGAASSQNPVGEHANLPINQAAPLRGLASSISRLVDRLSGKQFLKAAQSQAEKELATLRKQGNRPQGVRNDIRALADIKREIAKGPKSVQEARLLRLTDIYNQRLQRFREESRAGNTRLAARIKERMDAVHRAIDRESGALQRKAQAQTSATIETRDAIRHKRLSITVPVTVNTSSAIAFTQVQKAARISSRVATTTRAAVS